MKKQPEYKIIDLNHYDRREWFEAYYSEGSTRFSITINLDITPFWKKVKLYPFIMYHLTKVMNQYDCFRITMVDGKLVTYNYINPTFTSFNSQTKHFKLLHILWCEDFEVFTKRYLDEVKKYQDVDKFFVYKTKPRNYYNISMLPWVEYTSFNLNIPQKDFLIPVFTMGKVINQDGKYLLPFTASFNHSVCDGYHAGLLFTALQESINAFTTRKNPK